MPRESKYLEFMKCILFQLDFVFSFSLYGLLNEKYEVKTSERKKFIMPYPTFKKNLRLLRKYAAQSCGVVCYQDDEMCPGHHILNLMENHEKFIEDCVENKCLFYKYVTFEHVNPDRNKSNFGFVIRPFDEVDLGWKSWSQRMSYLN